MEPGPLEQSPEALMKALITSKRVKAGLRAETLRESMDPHAIMQAMVGLVEQADTIPIAELPKLKFKADIYSTLLRKCMPDLRSLEIKENSSSKSTLTIRMGASSID